MNSVCWACKCIFACDQRPMGIFALPGIVVPDTDFNLKLVCFFYLLFCLSKFFQYSCPTCGGILSNSVTSALPSPTPTQLIVLTEFAGCGGEIGSYYLLIENLLARLNRMLHLGHLLFGSDKSQGYPTYSRRWPWSNPLNVFIRPVEPFKIFIFYISLY